MAKVSRDLNQNGRDADHSAEDELNGGVPEPFSLEEVALSGGQAAGTDTGPSGQFSGDDLEFESFMFDAGDAQGMAPVTVPVTPEAQAPDGSPAPAWISGETVAAPTADASAPAAAPPPGAFVADA